MYNGIKKGFTVVVDVEVDALVDDVLVVTAAVVVLVVVDGVSVVVLVIVLQHAAIASFNF